MPRIGTTTRLLAVLGDPVGHSLSPVMQNAAIVALGLDAVYVALRVSPPTLPTVLQTLATVGAAGNITVPLKVATADQLETLTDRAQRLRAVNTFWSEDGKLRGDNTDVAGVLHSLQLLQAEGPWLVAGSGGAARAVAAAAAEQGVAIRIRSRSASTAAAFVEWATTLGVDARPDDGGAVGTVINTTPLGLRPNDPLPIPRDRTSGATAALDCVYAPGETPWVRACRTAGMRAVDGRVLLVEQGAVAFERFFPESVAPREIMRAAVAGALG